MGESSYDQKLKVVAVVASYFAISMSMVFLNKTLLSDSEDSIPAPLFITWFQCVVTAAIVAALGEYGRGAEEDAFAAQFPQFEFDVEVAKKILPLSVIFVSMITFNNLCLQYVEVSFYQVARGLTMVFNVALTFVFLGEKTSMLALGCCGVMILGFYVGVDNEVHFSFWGTVFGVTSSLFVSLNAIYTKKVISAVSNNKWKLALYNNLNACVMFPPLILLTGEGQIISQHAHLLYSTSFWLKMFLGGFFGFAIGIVVVFQITLTSPLTHNISGTAKAALQTVLALWIYQNPITAAGASGVVLVLAGSLLYAYVRTWEMDAKAKATKESAIPDDGGDEGQELVTPNKEQA